MALSRADRGNTSAPIANVGSSVFRVVKPPGVQSRRVLAARTLGARPGTTLVAVGNFDGVHRGHQAVIGAAARDAQSLGLEPLVLTFDPHPSQVLGRARLPTLTTLERKAELIVRIDERLRLVVEPFTLELAAKTPEEFARELLAEALGARIVIVGENFRFGNRRAGDLRMLQELGKQLGFEARAHPLSGDESGSFSSSRVREALAAGSLDEVERILGRPHALSGRVVRGDGRGRTIGVPTANLDGVAEALPPHGVYACVVDELAEGGPTALAAGVTNIGVRPTVEAGFSVETHLFDVDRDLYEKRLRLHLLQRLREERRFSGLDELKVQIARDVVQAREVAARRSQDPAAEGAWY
jgi:riboflavin kinase / FMN adenylyltransferase